MRYCFAKKREWDMGIPFLLPLTLASASRQQSPLSLTLGSHAPEFMFIGASARSNEGERRRQCMLRSVLHLPKHAENVTILEFFEVFSRL